jgi:hypothetical protein
MWHNMAMESAEIHGDEGAGWKKGLGEPPRNDYDLRGEWV